MRAIVVLLLAMTLAKPAPALAHAMLERSDPAAGAIVSASPPEIVITFSEALEPRFSSITLVDAAGHVVPGTLHIEGHTMSLAIPRLRAGVFEVRWRALSVDTHITEGAYRFTVAGT
jgi:methionine-rich copper-binding protein CopC